MNFDRLKTLLSEAAKKAGVEEYEIYYTTSSELSVGGLNKVIDSFSSSTSGGVCLRVLSDGKMGYASTELLVDSEISELVYRALENAKSTEKLDETGLFKGSPSYEAPRMKKHTPLEAGELKALTGELMEKCYVESAKVTDGDRKSVV